MVRGQLKPAAAFLQRHPQALAAILALSAAATVGELPQAFLNCPGLLDAILTSCGTALRLLDLARCMRTGREHLYAVLLCIHEQGGESAAEYQSCSPCTGCHRSGMPPAWHVLPGCT